MTASTHSSAALANRVDPVLLPDDATSEKAPRFGLTLAQVAPNALVKRAPRFVLPSDLAKLKRLGADVSDVADAEILRQSSRPFSGVSLALACVYLVAFTTLAAVVWP